MTEQDKNTPPPPSSIIPSTTGTSMSSVTGNTTNTRSNYKSYGGDGRSRQSYVVRKSDDAEFKGKEEYGVVVGGPAETRHLKHGVPYSEFVIKMRDVAAGKYDHGSYLLELFNKLKDPMEHKDFTDRPTMDTSIEVEKIREMDYAYELKEWKGMQRSMKETKKKLYLDIWGQCTPTLQNLIEADLEYEKKKGDQDPIYLLKTIRSIMTEVETSRNRFKIYYEKLEELFNMSMVNGETINSFLGRVRAQFELIRSISGGGVFQPNFTTAEGLIQTYDEDLEEQFLCMFVMHRSDRNVFGERLRVFELADEDGNDNYPTDSGELLTVWLNQLKRVTKERSGGRFERQFFTSNTSNRFTDASGYRGGRTGCIPCDVEVKDIVKGTNHEVWTVKCNKCERWGHHSKYCPNNETSKVSTASLMSHMILSQHRKVHNFDPNHYYIDSGANFSSSFDSNILHSVRRTRQHEDITALTNGGLVSFKEFGNLKLLPSVRVYYNETSVATILALKDLVGVPEAFVFYDSRFLDAFLLVFRNGRIMEFKRADHGLYYYDLHNFRSHEHKISDPSFRFLNRYSSFIQTVQELESMESKKNLEKANLARKYQEILMFPSSNDLKKILSRNLVKNAKVTSEDVDRGLKVYGENPAILKGKMTRPSPHSHDALTLLPLPPKLLGIRLHLYTDILHVNRLPFLLVISGGLNYVSVISLTKRTKQNIIKGLLREINRYVRRGMIVDHVHGDGEYDKEDIRDAVKPATLEIRAPEEHCGVAERSVRTVKDRTRCATNNLPYTQYPRVMVRNLVPLSAQMLNRFPSDHGVSDTISPAELVDGVEKFDFSKKHIPFGAFAQVYTGTDNSQDERCVEAIALRSSNQQDGYYFMSLQTGERISSNKWNQLPISSDVIRRVHELAEKENRPKMINKEMMFEWDEGVPIVFPPLPDDERRDDSDINLDRIQELENEGEYEMNDENEDIVEEQNDDDDVLRFDNEDRDMNIVSGDELSSKSEEDDNASYLQEIENNAEYDELDSREFEEEYLEEEFDDKSMTHKIDAIEKDINVRDSIIGIDMTGEEGKDDEERPEDISKRPKRQVRSAEQYTHDRISAYSGMQDAGPLSIRKKSDGERVDSSLMQRCVDIMFTQMSAKKGIRKFGERGLAAVIKEFTQLNEGAVPSQNKPVVVPIDPKTLSSDDKKKALNAVNLIEEKRDGRIKGRTCGDGSKQRRYLNYGDSVASPTVSLEGLLTTLVIASFEGRRVYSFDVPGAFLQAKLPDDKLLLLRLNNEFVDIMCQVNPEHKGNVVLDSNGKKVLYMKVVRALYGCIESALAWYRLFSETLENEGFTLNPYDRCIANKTINGKQCTIAWHVDDCVVTHAEKVVLDEFTNKMVERFGDMNIDTSSTHDFLGMKIRFTEDKKIEIDMTKQIEDLLCDFEQENEIVINDTVTSPTTEKIFAIDRDIENLDEFRTAQFHSTTAKLLYLMKRARPDLETGVSQLMRRVSVSNTDDWNKLLRVLGYLKRTKNDKRYIGASNIEELYTWIDASYAVHDDNMRSHTGGLITMGYGMITGKSSMQKLNVKSSTEAELVGVSEFLPYNLWLLNFLEHQGYKIKNNDVFQDNMSSMLLEKNGRNSCTGNTRHIKIRYFFVKDRIQSGELAVKYCPTQLMLADYFTKCLRGKLFEAQRSYIMGWRPMSELIDEIRDHKIKEGVEI